MSEAPSVRESIEAAIDGPAGGVPPAAPESNVPLAPQTPASPAGAAPAPPPAPAADRQPGAPAASPGAPKPAPANSFLSDKPPVAPAPPAAPELRAPASWKADLREHWKSLPPEVQSEVIRRERENDQRMQGAAEIRKFAERFDSIVNPYRAFIEAEGGEPLAAFHDYLKTATMLRTGAPNDKARMVAQLVSQYGVPLPALDAYLAQALQNGGAPINGPHMQQQQQPQQPYHDPRLDQLFEQMAAQQNESVTGDIEKFRDDPAHEFFDDVRLTMADVMDAAAKRGIRMGLEDAYVRACQIEPEVRKVMDQRNAQGSASQAARTLARARHAASSLPSQPAPPAPRGNGTAPPGSVRDAILQSIDALSGTG